LKHHPEDIQGYHAHIYFDAETETQARSLIERVAERFAVTVGRVHCRPVGPHPCWSCQLAFGPELFAELMPWLILNRQGLVVFTHPLTGDDLADHTDYVVWLGEAQPLDLSVFH